MTNKHSAFVHWRQTTTGLNTRMEYHDKTDNVGLCAGITAVWIKKSLASKGRGIKTAVELGSLHLMGIVHGAFKRKMPRPQDYDIADSITPLLNAQSLMYWDSMCGKYRMNPAAMALWGSLKPSHCLIAFNHQESGMGHVMGMRFEDNTLEMFDPGQGLFQYSDPLSSAMHLQSVIYGRYSKCIGGEWGVFRVKSTLD
ncbi:hypothetical protein [Endozoicomonas lisbonensis]